MIPRSRTCPRPYRIDRPVDSWRGWKHVELIVFELFEVNPTCSERILNGLLPITKRLTDSP